MQQTRNLLLLAALASGSSLIAPAAAGGGSRADAGPDPLCLWDATAPLRPRARTSCPLPVDDASPTHIREGAVLTPLRCIRRQRNSNSNSNSRSGDGESKCIYSAPTFRGGGFSIATGAQTAANLLGMGGLDDLIAPATSPHLFSTGPTEDVVGGGPAYEVQDIPGKGKGVIASRTIRRREVFMVDYPLLMVEGALIEGMDLAGRRGVLQGLVAGLGDEGRGRMLALARSGGEDEAMDLFVTNGCGVEVWGRMHTGVFPEVARMNHDCRPNAYFRFSPSTLTMEVLAYRDIQPGEEININYAYVGMPSKERQKFLRDTWSFNCTCPLCTSPPSVIAASDARRHDIARKRIALRKARKEGRHDDALGAAEGVLALLEEEEGLEALGPGFWGLLARELVELGRTEEALAWARRALEGGRAFRGEDSGAVAEAEDLVRAVEREERRMKGETTAK
ncbi:uncharacterized protein DNG_03062 [Cephalotrichum gorgonifer]|uniref:SET domain-containing protein n=1 Tax=Cephalotrichum gorgonifer TaxID=2041049 RepID=A0AAE8STW0_9PEZI|nr:uncharacterized protein DNG_03062 [Cephalotrichum gorgonifer]